MQKLLLLLLATYLVCSSCSKYKDDSQRRKFVSMMLDSSFIIGEDPKAVVTYADPSEENPAGFPTLLVSGFSYNKLYYTFSITSTDSLLHPGTYVSGMSGNALTLLDSSSHILSANADQGAFSLTILSVKDSTVQGEFTATLVNETSGESHQLQRGAFRTNFSRQ
ncbi:hypothetical protein GA0116948_10639 [Chitinophaga costaii]|uniref:Uncharacterized protein n=1 Tax=Chitinophaga costaii TaxID=1335309 RepID=A0A1C4DQA3_9BACT|nr:hypothetical protein [Chitinophaga costaii]PUZ27733.1 hypothetical protein DCM91_05840 [Chitinophaga costaii]SCC33420.1 hypothetical protein GA0116948_10639 [Chitinophaga costaii]